MIWVCQKANSKGDVPKPNKSQLIMRRVIRSHFIEGRVLYTGKILRC